MDPTTSLPRQTSLLATEGAENYPILPMMTLLCLVGITEGLDGGLFPAISKALENTVDFDVGTLGFMAMVQFLCQAFGGPVWGVFAARGIMTRKQILVIGTLMQGLATLVMWMFIENFTMLLIMRGFNGICLGALRPIANSIVGDRFDDVTRGKYFGYIYFCFILGTGLSQLFAAMISETVFFPDFPTFWGWKLSFIFIGVFTMSLAPAIHLCLRAPPVNVDANKNGGFKQEMQAIFKLLRMPTFAMIVLQGCFGVIPWRAMDFRIFFFETVGLAKTDAATVATLGGTGNLVGALASGFIGDTLNRVWPMHGRILTAELSVYGAIPIAFFTYFVFPNEEIAYWYYFSLTFALGAVAQWASAGCNSPVLCNLVPEDERSLVLAWQTSLEGAVGALGPVIFTFLLKEIFNYDTECNKEENFDRPDCQNAEAAGQALGYSTCVPWAFCGLAYTSLHYFYPRDLRALDPERDWAAEDQTELAS